jgi:hypothetical protein
VFVPRPSTNCSGRSQLASGVIQLPALGLGLCLAAGVLLLLPAIVLVVAVVELWPGRMSRAQSAS